MAEEMEVEKIEVENPENIVVPPNPDVVIYYFGRDDYIICPISEFRKSSKKYMEGLDIVSKDPKNYNILGWKKKIVREESDTVESDQFSNGMSTSYSYSFIFEKDGFKIELDITMGSDDFDCYIMHLCHYNINYEGFGEDADE
jgi:hypothetical protein